MNRTEFTTMMRIGDFSKLSQVSIKTLRYYDEIGLLKPIDIDRFTGYRFYSVAQLPRINRILALKDLGFSLEQILQAVNEEISPEQLRGMLRLRRAELQQHIVAEQERLTRIEARLSMIQMEDIMTDYEVILKQVEPQLVAGVRAILPDYPAIGGLLGEVYAYLGSIGVGGQGATIWYDEGFKTSDIDGEGIVYLQKLVPESERVKVHELPAATVASVVHKGAYNTFNQAYAAIGRWIEENGYRIVGPNREIYLYCADPVRQDDDSYVTEIQFPVEKI